MTEHLERILKFEDDSLISIPVEESLTSTAHTVFTAEQVKAIELITQRYLKAISSQK
ncbi:MULTISPECIES: hypothetical protein [Lactobacillaceae]|uniref:hypothetical protein n=1 Tax=Lactobacillaceae TaxID=33958 RepID=UPI00165271C5|nr:MULTISPECIES: hypothetical protein [Lactobacillaceae]